MKVCESKNDTCNAIQEYKETVPMGMTNMIAKDKLVTLHYVLREGNSEGPIVEDTYNGQPLTFKFGVGQMILGFEQHLEGMISGDTYHFILSSEDAYGAIRSSAIINMPTANFADKQGAIDHEKIKVNNPIRMKNREGKSFQGIIQEISQTSITVNFNHPMAGKSLHFSGEIIKVADDIGQG